MLESIQPDPATTPATAEALRDLIAAGDRLRHALSHRLGLSETELVAMQHLVGSPSAPGELARLLQVSTAASTGIVDRLERRGHVERRPDLEDRRRVAVHVTDSGRSEVVTHLMPMLVALGALDETFSESEREVVLRFLTGAVAALDEASSDPSTHEPG